MWSSTERSMSVISGGIAEKGRRAGGRSAGSAGSGGMEMTLSTLPVHALAVPAVDITTLRIPRWPPGRGRHGARAASGGGLKSTVCALRPSGRSQRCSRWPYFWPQQLRDQAVLDHRGSAPLAGDQGVLVEVPPGVVGQVLGAAVGVPRRAARRSAVVEQRDAARPVGGTYAGEEDAVRSAVQAMRAGVAGPAGEPTGLDGLVQLGGARVGPGVINVMRELRRPGSSR